MCIRDRTYTTPETHRSIWDNLDRAPMYSGSIHGTGARYCPSIEDKIVRFRDKDRHPIFLEPEGLHTNEWYVQGMSTSMPEDVQRMIYASVPGLEKDVYKRQSVPSSSKSKLTEAWPSCV